MEAKTILEGLNSQQKRAVRYTRGPLLIIAGAGTGKTQVITRRIAYLIISKKAKPDEILALTFTDKAAAEMEERVDILVPYGYTDIWISTFHAFGDRILRENALELGLEPNFQVLTRPESIIFFREHLFEFPLDYFRPLSNPAHYIGAMVTLFSRAKDEDISPGEYLEYAKGLKRKSDENPEDQELAELANREMEVAKTFAKYQELLAKFGKVDFGNQFYLTLQLFRTHPLILKRYQSQFKYILVDEFQDTNYAQFQLVKLLAERYRNITVVSDDDQCVFRFRGAAYSNILNFMEAYPDAEKVSLIKNYRSTQIILDTAYRLIQYNNPDRFEVKSNINKRLVGISKRGKPPQHLHFDNLSSEADAVARIIQEKVDSGKYSYQDFAILVRSNSDADPFLRSLNMRGIPWHFTGNQGLYAREEIRLIISFLRAITNLKDSVSLYHLSQSEIYFLDMVDLTRCMNFASRRNQPLLDCFKNINFIPELQNLSSESKATIAKITKDIEKFVRLSRTHTTGRVLYLFLTESGYLERLSKAEDTSSDAKIQNIAKFFNIVKNFETIAFEDRVVHFVNHLDMLIQAGDDPATVEADVEVPAVNVLTIHKAKGLEFRVVFLVSLVMGRFPWPRRRESIELPEALIKDILPSGDFHIEEERRLFYVGMTRAKEELYFASARDYGGSRPRKISQFVLEALDLPKEEAKVAKTTSLEAIKRHAPPPELKTGLLLPIPDDKVLTLSYFQIDDYLTCPLKYKYVHILRVPILQHHTVAYGKSLHDAVAKYLRFKIAGRPITEGELIATFEASWRSEGFLSREHEEQRLRAGSHALRRFFKEQESSNKVPTYVEKEFSFVIGQDRIIGRWDRIDIFNNEVSIIDFKSSEIRSQRDADRRTKESLQMSIYALAYQKVFGSIPHRVELHFLETGLVGVDKKNKKDLEATRERIKGASKGIRSRNFQASPTYLACRYCAYSQICPHTASGR